MFNSEKKAVVFGCFLVWMVFFCKPDLISQNTEPAPRHPIPTEAQLRWHELETYAFIHFTINTFTGKEWGYGDESPELFNPTDLDVSQWVEVIKKAGLKGVILTAKHHDGFCLWPSSYNEHNVRNSPWLEGKGDLVKLLSEACAENGLRFGLYLSPWDRNHPDYGTDAYVAYYRNQATELATQYGPLFEWWLDGANGGDCYYGGARETRRIDRQSYYNWPATISMIRTLQPNILFFSDAGPDIRWVGNEAGYAGETNWCRLSPDTLYPGKAGISNLLGSGDQQGNSWIPAEVDVSIRPGWFYHEHEDSLVKSPERLFEIYLTSVGRGANLLLNIPPDKRGRIHEKDEASLLGWKKMIDSVFNQNLAKKATVFASHVRASHSRYAAANLTDDQADTYWATDDAQHSGSLSLAFETPQKIQYIVLQEYIQLGQRIHSFEVEYFSEREWKPLATGTTIGYKRIIPFEAVHAEKIRIHLYAADACIVMSNLEVY